MVIWWSTGPALGGTSTDPGPSNVSSGVSYEINGIPKVGTLNSVTNIIQGQPSLVGPQVSAVLVEG